MAEIAGSPVARCASTTMPSATSKPASAAISWFGTTPIPMRRRSAFNAGPVGEDHAGDPTCLGDEVPDTGTEREPHSRRFMGLREVGRGLRRDRARHRPLRGLDDADGEAAGRADAREFEADEPGTDDHHRFRSRQVGLEAVGIGERAKMMHPGEFGTRPSGGSDCANPSRERGVRRRTRYRRRGGGPVPRGRWRPAYAAAMDDAMIRRNRAGARSARPAASTLPAR